LKFENCLKYSDLKIIDFFRFDFFKLKNYSKCSYFQEKNIISETIEAKEKV
jgi:hypothetical protein